MNRSTSDDIDPTPGRVAFWVFAGMWMLLGVWSLSSDLVWAGMANIVFGLMTGLGYEIRRSRKRRISAAADDPARTT